MFAVASEIIESTKLQLRNWNNLIITQQQTVYKLNSYIYNSNGEVGDVRLGNDTKRNSLCHSSIQ